MTKKNAGLAALIFAPVVFAIATGCSKPKPPKPEPPPPPPPVNESIRIAIGDKWEGKDKKGIKYTFVLTNAVEWESLLEEDGISRNYYKGTFEQKGATLSLTITHEVDLRTMGWRDQRGNIGPKVNAKISGNTLTIEALAEAVLTRK
jgi:hypothetical protein